MFDYIDYMWVKFFAILAVIFVWNIVYGFINGETMEDANKRINDLRTKEAQNDKR